MIVKTVHESCPGRGPGRGPNPAHPAQRRNRGARCRPQGYRRHQTATSNRRRYVSEDFASVGLKTLETESTEDCEMSRVSIETKSEL